jgi:hypothetical protein
VTEIPIGSQGKGFDRLDLDAWLDDYKESSVRPGIQQKGEGKPWRDRKACPALSIAKERTTSTKSSEAGAFAKALERATKKNPALVIMKKKPRLAVVC